MDIKLGDTFQDPFAFANASGGTKKRESGSWVIIGNEREKTRAIFEMTTPTTRCSRLHRPFVALSEESCLLFERSWIKVLHIAAGTLSLVGARGYSE